MLRFAIRIMGSILTLVAFSVVNLACSQEAGQPPLVNVRISVESQLGKTGIVRVFVEGPQGQVASGATVTATTFSNQIVRIPFDTEEWCHKGSIVLPLGQQAPNFCEDITCSGKPGIFHSPSAACKGSFHHHVAG